MRSEIDYKSLLHELIFRTRLFYPETPKEQIFFDEGITENFRVSLSYYFDIDLNFQNYVSQKYKKLSTYEKFRKSLRKLFKLFKSNKNNYRTEFKFE